MAEPYAGLLREFLLGRITPDEFQSCFVALYHTHKSIQPGAEYRALQQILTVWLGSGKPFDGQGRGIINDDVALARETHQLLSE